LTTYISRARAQAWA